MMRIAKFRCPSNDNSSRLVMTEAPEAALRTLRTRSSLSEVNDACMVTLSRVILRNSNEVNGPTVFSTDSGTPRYPKASLSTEIQPAGGDDGKSTTKKSSSRCKTNGNRWTFKRIQHSASDSVLKIRGLLRQPKANLTEKVQLAAPPNAE